MFWTDLESESPTAEPQPESRGQGERILLVEDNVRVRAAISEMLRAGGYEVLQAANASEAIEIFEQEEDSLDMVISDVVLPNRNGLQLVDQLRSRATRTPGIAHQRLYRPASAVAGHPRARISLLAKAIQPVTVAAHRQGSADRVEIACPL